MTPLAPARPVSPVPPVPVVARVSMVFGSALLAGVLTSFGQAVGPLSTLSNSAGPWFLVAVVLLLGLRIRTGRAGLALAMVSGVVLLELLHVGYWATSNLRGFPDTLSPTSFWVLMAVPAGVLAGAVSIAVRSADGRQRGAAAGAVAAVLIGEGMRSLLQVAATTGVVTWIVEIGVGVAVLVTGIVLARSPGARVLALGTGVVGSVAVLATYLLLGS
ncbi:DUF6518 family protein [Microbacterium sp. M1A1_1b]|uniref:DUF6518 family protein n=1 Tax=Curtobacterium sp. VKM Ac-2922 TaxID=2929475 RepID=UPI001FB276CB|nr:DUF6518 family protein [Curtobacterium sp. VKM Ac-2922]MCJ1715694.1 DUF6518 family protein [Curtobacterium sp. VKM Ac-2922]